MKTDGTQRLEFWKYHGAGNDFIIIDNRTMKLEFQPGLVQLLCDRHLGIGADGLISIENAESADFRMIYFNSDGYEGSMCGNGGRSAAAFAFERGIAPAHCRFHAYDGIHEAWTEKRTNGLFHVRLSMSDVTKFNNTEGGLLIDTGSPHFVKKVESVDLIDVQTTGSRIRYDKAISEKGVNVNFVQCMGSILKVRTYERGVEAETLSCGTGVTASAIANYLWNGQEQSEIHTKGGVLRVTLRKSDNRFTNIFLEGPVQEVFNGSINVHIQ